MGDARSSISHSNTDDPRLTEPARRIANRSFFLVDFVVFVHVRYVAKFLFLPSMLTTSHHFIERSLVSLSRQSMSTGVLPDMYRHTARKSTVSKSLKAPTAVVYQHATTAYSNGIQASSTYPSESIACHIKLEEHLIEPLFLLPENETEQMIVDEHIDRSIEHTIDEIIDQIERRLSPRSLHRQLADDDQVGKQFSLSSRYASFA